MRVLVIGGGGREHALVWKIAQSSRVGKIYCAPGNAGIAQLAECVPIRADDVTGLTRFAEENHIDLTVVGPEAPLMQGLVDGFEARSLPIVGPASGPARLEGSKIFAKKLMEVANIPTAPFWICESHEAAFAQLDDFYRSHPADTRIVLKADGLAAGKGVVVAKNATEARDAVHQMMVKRIFGTSGDRIVIEECLIGEEASIMALTDGNTVIPLAPSQDHKRAYEGDLGPNTGGMGAYSPVPVLPPDVVQTAVDQILRPAIRAIGELGIPYRGVLYAGIMVTPEGLRTIEFNCRLGDPETQAVLPLLDSDLVPLLQGVAECSLDEQEVAWRPYASVCVVAASGGYPGAYETGKPISGLEAAAQSEGCLVFHAGTRRVNDQIVTDGGRVLSVTGLCSNIRSAQERAYAGMQHIQFEGIYYRKDIAARSLTDISH